jgi:hypothetical protein
MKGMRVRPVAHVARMKNIRNAYKSLVKMLNGRGQTRETRGGRIKSVKETVYDDVNLM